MRVGPHNILLVSRIKEDYQKAVFECLNENCKEHFVAYVGNATSGQVKYCPKCRHENRKKIGENQNNNPKRKEAVLNAVQKIAPG